MYAACIRAMADGRGMIVPAAIHMGRGNGLDVTLSILEDAACPIRPAAAQERA